MLLAPVPGGTQPPATAPSPAPAPASTPSPVPGTTGASSAPTARPDTLLAPGGPRIVVGPDYRLGPGDLIEIQITGRIDVQRTTLVVDIEGNVNIPPIGNIPVGGLTLLEATRRVTDKARAFFRFADVTITVLAPRSFEVAVTGEVQRPGASLVSAARRLQDVVLGAGGPTPRGSVRRVRVTKDDAEREYDLLRFELGGDLTQNPLVEEGMRIHVPPRGITVALTGGVKRPGEYEVLPNGSLAELLALVGGFSETAAPSAARLTRFATDGRRETLTVDLRTALARPADVTLKPGDALFVPTVSPLQDVIEIRGAFVGTAESAKGTVAGKPIVTQRLEIAQGDRIRDVVGRLGGVAPTADLRLAFVDRTPSAGPPQRIPVDLHKLYVDKDEAQNLALENGDAFNLPVLEDKIYLNGEIKGVGPQDFRPEWTARDYIASAGGLNFRAKPKEAFVTFRNGRTYLLADAPSLEPGATIVVPEVSVKWYQDYLAISNTLVGLVTAYAGLYVLFGGSNSSINIFGTSTTTTTNR
jgi:polysaccharide export outer membrane protein